MNKALLIFATAIIFLICLSPQVTATPAQDDHGDSINKATTFNGKKARGRLEKRGDVDFLAFDARPNRTYIIDVKGKANVKLELFNEEGLEVASDTGYNRGEVKPHLICMTEGRETLYLKVQGLRKRDKGKYRIMVQNIRTKKYGPAERADLTLAYDPVDHYTWLFGGAVGGTFFNDLWRWTGNNWRLEDNVDGPDGRPAVRSRHAMAWMPGESKLVLFGGRNNQKIFGDTWTFDGQEWSKLEGGGPSAREGAQMVYDPNSEAIMLFGGNNGDSYYDDLWFFDGNGWQEFEKVSAATTDWPVERARHAMTWHPQLEQVILVGGENDGLRSMIDVWLWNGQQWSELEVNGWGFRGVKAASLVWHGEDERIYLYGGNDGYGENSGNLYYLGGWEDNEGVFHYYWYQQWFYNQEAPSALSGHAMVYDSHRHEMLLHGGWDEGYTSKRTWLFRFYEWFSVFE